MSYHSAPHSDGPYAQPRCRRATRYRSILVVKLTGKIFSNHNGFEWTRFTRSRTSTLHRRNSAHDQIQVAHVETVDAARKLAHRVGVFELGRNHLVTEPGIRSAPVPIERKHSDCELVISFANLRLQKSQIGAFLIVRHSNRNVFDARKFLVIWRPNGAAAEVRKLGSL
jgi:hypothetical protein